MLLDLEYDELRDDDEDDLGDPIDIEEDVVKHVPFEFKRLAPEESVQRSKEFYELMNKRRTLRFYSPDPVPIEVIHNIIKTAGIYLLQKL